MSYLVVTGTLANKGSQAMTFNALQRLAERFPDHELVLLTREYEMFRENLANFRFTVLPWKPAAKLAFLGPLVRTLTYPWRLMHRNDCPAAELRLIEGVLRQADLAVDVSGFALSSQWPLNVSLNYLLNLAVMQRYGIKTYLLPQSFGPFNYGPVARAILTPLLGRYLKYPAKIFAREKSGLAALSSFSADNSDLAPDSVITCPGIDLRLIYREVPARAAKGLLIPGGSVAVVPNVRVMRHREAKLLAVYREIVRHLLEEGRHVYVLWHSPVDRRAWKTLREALAAHPRLIFLDLDLNCVEMVELFARFDIVCAARYHASVHAYKAGVPALVFGWSDKYRELMTSLGQEQYLFDVRDSVRPEDAAEALRRLLANRGAEAVKIREGVARLCRARDVFAEIELGNS